MVTDTREVGYKVHGERGPRSTGKWKWVEKAVGTMASRFGADTDVTCLDKIFDQLPRLGPSKPPRYQLQCFCDPKVADKRIIMAIL